MIPRPPSSTLFPCTTLFRSLRGVATTTATDMLGERARDCPYIESWFARHDATDAETLERMARRDRKSTRLNSSHPVISYAVFCLKKKKKANRQMYVNKNVDM